MSAVLRRLAHEDGGFSLIELLVGLTIFIVILSAVLLSFNEFESTNRLANDRNDSQERARHELDIFARDLRNLASPTPEQPQAVDKATAYDIVFQAVDPAAPGSASLNTTNVRRVRYCVNNTDPTNEVLWMQWQTWTTKDPPNPAPSTTNCPDNAWGTTNRRQVTANVTNRINGQDRSLFSFNSATAADINRIHVDLYIDLTPGRNPSETHLTTGVFLRNQNRKPSADFTWTTTGYASGSKRVLLNGSASEDPEGDPLTYSWYDLTGGAAIGPDTYMGGNITCDCVAKGAGTRSIVLRVADQPGLTTDSTAKSVPVP